MGFSLKKLTRSLDPTSKTSALGGVVRKGLDAAGASVGIPPGTISKGLETVGANNKAGKTTSITIGTAGDKQAAGVIVDPNKQTRQALIIGLAAVGVVAAIMLMRK